MARAADNSYAFNSGRIPDQVKAASKSEHSQDTPSGQEKKEVSIQPVKKKDAKKK